MELQKPNQTNLKPLDVRGAVESTSPRNKTAPSFAIRTMQEDLVKELGVAPPAPKPIKPSIEEFKPLTAPPPEKLPVVAEPRPGLKPPAPPEARKIILPPPPKPPAPPEARKIILPPPTKPPAPPEARKIILPPPPKPPALKIKEEAKKLFQEGLVFYKQKLYLEAIEKLEKILPLKISWWIKYRAKRYIKRSRRRMAQTEQQYQKKQKQLEKKLKKEQELKLKAEKSLEEKLRKEKLIREEEEKKKVVAAARLTAERISAEALEKAQQETEAKKIAEDRKMGLLRQEAENKKIEEAKRLAEERARLEEIRKTRLKLEEETKTKATGILKEEQSQIEAIRRQALERSRLETEEARQTYLEEEKAKQARLKEAPPAPPAPPLPVPEPITKPPLVKPPLAPPITPQPTKIKPKIKLAPAIKIILTLFIIFLGAFFYWQSRQKIIAPAPEKPTPPVTVELTPPQPLLPVDVTENISIKKEALNALADRLEIIAQKENQPGSLKRILIELTNQETSYLTIKQLIEALDIKMPSQLLANLTDDYTLFFYTQINLSESPFLAGQGRARLGLIIKIENENEVKNLMAQWEPTIKSDLVALLLGKKIPLTNNQFFQDNIYQNISIRYLNLPDRYLSIDYALINDKLLITTSQESAYEAINRLVQ